MTIATRQYASGAEWRPAQALQELADMYEDDTLAQLLEQACRR